MNDFFSESGDYDYLCALVHDKCVGLHGDAKVANLLYDKAIASGNTKAAAALGYKYENGIGVEQSTNRAMSYYLQAAGGGHPVAQYNLANLMFAQGNEDDAFTWWQQSSDQGYLPARVCLARAYRDGRGTSANPSKSVKILQQAVFEGSTCAMLELSICYQTGQGVEKNLGEAERLLRDAGNHGEPRAWEELGSLIYYGVIESERQREDAIRYYELAASQGVTSAQLWCGEIYAFGHYVEKDLLKGALLLIHAASSGNPRARYLLAVLIANGELCGGDLQLAFDICLQSALEDEADAQYMIATMYETGNGVNQSSAKASDWLKRSATNGNEQARRRIPQAGTDKN